MDKTSACYLEFGSSDDKAGPLACFHTHVTYTDIHAAELVITILYSLWQTTLE